MSIDTIFTFTPGIFHWLVLSSLLFSIGVYGVLTRRNAIGILIALEIALNSGALNFVIFNSYIAPASVDGQIMSIFVIAIAAAEIVVAMAILVALYKFRRSTDVTGFADLKELHDPAMSEHFLDALVSPAAKPQTKVGH